MYSLMKTSALKTSTRSLRPPRSACLLLALGGLLCPAWAYAEATTAPQALGALFYSIERSTEHAVQATGATLRTSGENARDAVHQLRQASRDLLHGARAEGARAKREVLESRDELARWLGLAPR
jgi:hypothetical protein